MHTAECCSEGTLTPWIGLLIDQSALTAVRRELLTLWLQRVCVQWSCKGSLALTQFFFFFFALPWRRWMCAHTLTHRRFHAGGTYRPRQSPSGMHSHRTVSMYSQAGGGDVGRFFLLWLCTGPVCILAWLLPPMIRWATSGDPILRPWPFVLWYLTAGSMFLPHACTKTNTQ